MKDALGHGSNGRGDASAHVSGVNNVGNKFRLNSFTHEIVDPNGNVAARLRVGKSSGVAVDQKGVGQISRSGGTAIHDTVAMADYRAKGTSFPAEHIGGALQFLTGHDFAGHTVRKVGAGDKADAQALASHFIHPARG